MKKQQFLKELENALKGLPQEEIEDTLYFYSEAIDDRAEYCGSEELAVISVGSAKEIANELLKEIPLPKLVKEAMKSRRTLRAWEIVLLILGSPIWLSLLIAALAVALSIWVSLWSIVIALWACEASFMGCTVGGIFASAYIWAMGINVYSGFILLAASIFLAGLSILFFFVCKKATKVMICITKKIPFWIKSCFLRKEEV